MLSVVLLLVARGEGAGVLSLTPLRIPEPAGALWARWSGPVAEGDFFGLSCGPKASPDDWLSVRNVTPALFEDLVAMRCSYVVEYISGGVVIAAAQAEMELPADYPRQGHLQVAGSDGEETMLVFVTNSSSSAPQLQFWPLDTLDNVSTVSFGTTVTYAADSMCGGTAAKTGQRLWRHPGFIHSVSFGSLEQDGQCYGYRFGQAGLWSNNYTHCTPQQDGVTRFCAFADVGSWTGDGDPRTVVARMAEDALSEANAFSLLVGDLSYAEGRGFMWDQFGTMLEPLALRVPVQVTVGNHEYDIVQPHCANDPSLPQNGTFQPVWGNYGEDSGGEAAVPVVARFSAPGNGNGVFWYTFVRGLVRVVALSGEHDFLPGSEQHSWLAATVKRHNRTATPFLVIAIHRPLYTRGGGEADASDVAISLQLRNALEPLLVGVADVLVAGHEHTATRSCPVAKGKCRDQDGIVHFTAGTGGAGCGPPCPPRGPYPSGDDDWSRFHYEGFGYLRFEASRQEMRIQFVESTTGAVLDESIIKAKAAAR